VEERKYTNGELEKKTRISLRKGTKIKTTSKKGKIKVERRWNGFNYMKANIYLKHQKNEAEFMSFKHHQYIFEANIYLKHHKN
jgi:hypothetical protein